MNNGNVKREELPKTTLPGGMQGGNSGAMDQTKQTGNSGVMDQAKKAATQIASEVTEQAKDKVSATIGAQKEKAAGSIDGVADALRQSGRSLRDHDTAMPAEYVDRAAEQIERIGHYVRNRTLGQLVGDAEEFARREPAIFFGGAFALGLLAARFLKSSEPKPETIRQTQPMGSQSMQSRYSTQMQPKQNMSEPQSSTASATRPAGGTNDRR